VSCVPAGFAFELQRLFFRCLGKLSLTRILLPPVTSLFT
jgi:hypothetical protein